MWQRVKLLVVSLGTRLRDSLVADEDVEKPNKQNKAWMDTEKAMSVISATGDHGVRKDIVVNAVRQFI